jgi:hypothetical protein
MSWTYPVDALRQVVLSSLFVAGGGYLRCANGDLVFRGSRPKEGLHGHGMFSRMLWVLVGEKLQHVKLWKQRWLDPCTGKTCHSRPPDECRAFHSCLLIVMLRLWAWLDGQQGLAKGTEVHQELTMHPPPARVQSWLGRLLPHAYSISKAVADTIKGSEPRPDEQTIQRGQSPPDGLRRRRWRDPSRVGSIWRAIADLIGGALDRGISAAVLLAEARGRWDNIQRQETQSPSS